MNQLDEAVAVVCLGCGFSRAQNAVVAYDSSRVADVSGGGTVYKFIQRYIEIFQRYMMCEYPRAGVLTATIGTHACWRFELNTMTISKKGCMKDQVACSDSSQP